MREYISADLSFSAAFFILQKMGLALHSPSGIIMYQHMPNGVMKPVFSSSSMWSHIW
jgi:hypothetical protein